MHRPLLAGMATCALVVTTAALAAPSNAGVDTSTPAVSPTATPGGGDQTGGLSPTRTPAITDQLNVRVSAPNATSAALSFLTSNAAKYALTDVTRNLVPSGSSTSGTTLVERFDQRYQGLPVVGAQYVVRLRDDAGAKTVTGTSGQYFSDLSVNTNIDIPLATARAVARHSMSAKAWAGVTGVQDKGLVVLPVGKGLLARHVTVVGADVERNLPLKREVFVAFGQSKPVLSYDNVQADGPVTTTGDGFHSPTLPLNLFKKGPDYLFRDQTKPMFASHKGVIETYDGAGVDARQLLVGDIPEGMQLEQSTTIPVPASVNEFGSIDAHWGAGKVYDFYRGLGRDSLDGKGGSIKSVVDVTLMGGPYVNAFWNGDIMVYGTGGGDLKSFAASLDVVGHEMTHGVVSNSSKLLYIGQSGAINEAFADYFGNTIENATLGIPNGRANDGLMGEDLCKTASPRACAIRDLNSLMTTLELFRGTEDNGGVHLNSPIVSGSLWQIRHALGVKKTDKILYDVMTQYLSPLSQFIDVRNATLAAARANGATAEDITAIETAFTRHGIVPNWESRIGGRDSTLLLRPVLTQSSPENAGDRYVLANFALDTMYSEIYTGMATRPGPVVKLSTNAGPTVANDIPATDGKTAVWTETTYTSSGPVVAVKQRAVTGGPETTVTTIPNGLLWDLAVDGQTVAWEYTDGNDVQHVAARLPNGKIVNLPGKPDTEQTGPSISGDWIVYGESAATPTEFSTARLMRYNIKTNATTAIASIRGKAESSAYIYQPQIVGNQVLFLSDRQYRFRNGVSQVPLAGGKIRVLIDEDNALAPIGSSLSANDQMYTWENYGSFDEPARIYAKSRSGGPIQRVTCSPGSQYAPLAGDGTRIMWLDTSSSTPDLVMRAKPRGSC